MTAVPPPATSIAVALQVALKSAPPSFTAPTNSLHSHSTPTTTTTHIKPLSISQSPRRPLESYPNPSPLTTLTHHLNHL
jgi:hypothetical protein